MMRLPRPLLVLLSTGPLVASLLATSPSATATPVPSAPSGPWTVRWASQPSPAAPPSTGDSYSSTPSISADGTLVTFGSTSQLAADGGSYSPGIPHAYTSAVGAPDPVRLAQTPKGAFGNGGDTQSACSICPTVSPSSANGRTVVFTSTSSNLTPRDTNGVPDVFRRDLRTGAIKLVSHAPDGSPADGPSAQPQVSADGRWVLYTSSATNLTPDPPQLAGVHAYLYDAVTDLSRRLDVIDDPFRDSYVLSSSGAKLLLETDQRHSPADLDNKVDTYVVDLATEAFSLVSVNNAGKPLHGVYPSISDDDTKVSFTYYQKSATTWLAAVRNLTTGRTTTVPGSQGTIYAHLSGDGTRLVSVQRDAAVPQVRYTEVVDLSGQVLYRSAPMGDGATPSIDRDGSCIAFESPVPQVTADVNTTSDVYTACQG